MMIDGRITHVACEYCGDPNHPLRSRCHGCGTPLRTQSAAAVAYTRLMEQMELRRNPDTAPLAKLLTLDRQRSGQLETMGACCEAGALETLEELFDDALDYAHYRGPFWVNERTR